MNWRRVSVVALLMACAGASQAAAQANDAVRAPLVTSRVRVQWNETAGKIFVAIDDDPTFRPLAISEVFLTPAGLVMTYPRLNPLRIAAVSAQTDAGAAPASACGWACV